MQWGCFTLNLVLSPSAPSSAHRWNLIKKHSKLSWTNPHLINVCQINPIGQVAFWPRRSEGTNVSMASIRYIGDRKCIYFDQSMHRIQIFHIPWRNWDLNFIFWCINKNDWPRPARLLSSSVIKSEPSISSQNFLQIIIFLAHSSSDDT